MPGAEVNTAPVLPTNSKHNPFSEGFDFAKKVPFPRAQGRRSSLANRANILQFRPRTVRRGSMEINHITKSVLQESLDVILITRRMAITQRTTRDLKAVATPTATPENTAPKVTIMNEKNKAAMTMTMTMAMTAATMRR